MAIYTLQKGITTMSYDEKAKARMVKYMQSKRESLRLNLPLGGKIYAVKKRITAA